MSATNFERCQYVLEDGVHHFTVFEFSRSGADDFISAIDTMNRSADAGLPVLVDSSRGSLPLGYMIGRFRDLYRVSPKPPQQYKIAVIAQPNILNSTIDGMIRMFVHTRVRLFAIHEREAALDWLRQK